MVASFYLPVTLTKPAASIAKDDAAGSWTAEWDYEQLVALQVRSTLQVAPLTTLNACMRSAFAVTSYICE